MTAEKVKLIDDKAERIKRYCTGELSRKLGFPVQVEDATCRIIADQLLSRGKGDIVWLKGREVERSKITLVLLLDCHGGRMKS